MYASTSFDVKAEGCKIFIFLKGMFARGRQNSLPTDSPSLPSSNSRNILNCLIVALLSSDSDEFFELWLQMAPLRSEQRRSYSLTLLCNSAYPSPRLSTTPIQNTPSASCTAPTSSSADSMKLPTGTSSESATKIP